MLSLFPQTLEASYEEASRWWSNAGQNMLFSAKKKSNAKASSVQPPHRNHCVVNGALPLDSLCVKRNANQVRICVWMCASSAFQFNSVVSLHMLRRSDYRNSNNKIRSKSELVWVISPAGNRIRSYWSLFLSFGALFSLVCYCHWEPSVYGETQIIVVY